MENTLSLTLKQQLRLSQSQIQKLEMLALSYDELEAVIRKEEEVNPFLEVKAGRYSAESTYRPIDSSLDYLSKDDEDEKAGWMERAISVKESLYEHLRMQIETLNLSDKEKEAALIIASSLDSKGFLPQPLDQILPSRYEDVRESALKVVQSLDPSGVGASDYKESLKIQLKGLGLQKEDENNISYMIDNMELIKGSRTDLISKKLGIDEEEARLLIDVLKTLTPYPGEKYNTEFETYIHPDIAIKKNPSSGEIEITDYGDNLPDVRLSAEYVDLEEEMVKYIISAVLEEAPEEMQFLNSFVDKGLIERLIRVRDADFARVPYTEAIEILASSGAPNSPKKPKAQPRRHNSQPEFAF